MVSLPPALWLALVEPLIPCIISFPLLPQNQLEAHQDEGMVISHMAVAGVGIWIAFTSGSTLRLFHTETLKHLQDVNIDAPVHSMLPGTLRGREGFLGSLSHVQLAARYPRRKGRGQQSSGNNRDSRCSRTYDQCSPWTLGIHICPTCVDAQPLCVLPGVS